MCNLYYFFMKFLVGNINIFLVFSVVELCIVLKMLYKNYYCVLNMCLCVVSLVFEV